MISKLCGYMHVNASALKPRRGRWVPWSWSHKWLSQADVDAGSRARVLFWSSLLTECLFSPSFFFCLFEL